MRNTEVQIEKDGFRQKVRVRIKGEIEKKETEN